MEIALVIVGRRDTWFTIEEFAGMIGRSEKTVRNWVAGGQLQFVHLCGVPLISMAMLENLITGIAPHGSEDGKLALRLSKRTDSRAPTAIRNALTRSTPRGSVSRTNDG